MGVGVGLKPAPTLFDFAEHPLIDEIKKTDFNSMTPLDALAKLAEWKNKLK